MKIESIAVREDNYIWIIEKNGLAIVVDPGEGGSVIDYLSSNHLRLAAILITHEHEDHHHGVKKIVDTLGSIPIYGPSGACPLINRVVVDGQKFQLLGIEFETIATPGHSDLHHAYLTKDWLFAGDALFLAGCGRVFTGDYQAQFDTLNRLRQLEDEILVFSGHEYSLKNLAFAKTTDPNNKLIDSTMKEVEEKIDNGQPSLPTTIGLEKQINPFLLAKTFNDFKRLRDQRDQF